jgi:tetratricopeptide (TPR) repeat protein
MGEASSHSSDAPWRGDQSPCVYCGQVIARASERCPHCRTSFSLAVRRASREIFGPWFYLDPRNPSGRGVTFEMLIKMVEKGRLQADSIVRGPTTHQDWLYAAETPRLAKYLGLCPHCFASAKPEDTYCTSCQLNMNERPADSRPGVPADLAKPPYHPSAYEIEKELARSVPSAAEEASGGPSEAAPASTAAEAVAAFAERPTPTPERTGLVLARPVERKPKMWVVFALTWATLIPLVLIWVFAVPAGWKERLFNRVRSSGNPTGSGGNATGPNGQSAPADPWVNEQLEEADRASAAGDFGRAIAIYEELVRKTGDQTWNARIQDLRVKQEQEDRRRRLAELRNRLKLAEQLAADHRYADALAILRNIAKEDRELLATINVSVLRMQAVIEEDAAKWRAEGEKRQKLAAQLEQAKQLADEGELSEALAAYDQIAADFPAELIQEKININQVCENLRAQIEAASRPPTPPPPSMTPAEIAAAVAKLVEEANTLEKGEKFGETLSKLEEVKNYDRKFWPEGLENRIESIKAKKEALEFFGMGADKRP